jgi:hypothetical protein
MKEEPVPMLHGDEEPYNIWNVLLAVIWELGKRKKPVPCLLVATRLPTRT